jgi:hypothetical protein
MRPNFTISGILSALTTWARHVDALIETDGVYLFGSLINRDGVQFLDDSDVDLVVLFPKRSISATNRSRWLESLHTNKADLEAELSSLLRRKRNKPICSLVVATTTEVWADLHKEGAHAFFSSKYFLNLLTDNKVFGLPDAGTRHVVEPLAEQCIRFVQKKGISI